MTFLRTNLPWIAPTAAIVLLATGAFDRVGDMIFNTKTAEQVRESAGSDAASTQLRVQELNQSVVSALATATGETVIQEGAATGQVAPAEDVVTRTTADLLETAPQIRPEPRPLPEPVAAVDTAAAADFFAAAQQNLALDNSCREDLSELAARARVYFPTGGLVVEDAGLSAARLIGMVAQECSGVTVQVEGHSDPSGDPKVNQRLSKQRAQAVISRLGASGLDVSNFVAVGFGDTRPSNATGPKPQAFYDRRVEFSIVANAQQARPAAQTAKVWGKPASDCVRSLETAAAQARQFYAPRAITAPADGMTAVYDLVAEAAKCEGAWLRIVGHHSDAPGSRESIQTGRLRALAMFSALATAGYNKDRILIGAPSYSAEILDQPGMPKGRIEFQIITD